MAENYKISSTGLLIQNNRIFIPSRNINIFPCSRRGQFAIEPAKYYDPEARLNTERTNRLHTAINGFKDSFIVSFKGASGNDITTGRGTLVFSLMGYRTEIKDFAISDIIAEDTLNLSEGTVYAYLSLHGGISLNVQDYDTEILYRQSIYADETNKNYLDIYYKYTETDSNNVVTITRENDFFVGISFTADKDARDTGVTPYVLPLFSKVESGAWELVQTSLLPKVEHDTEPDSIKLSGDFTVKHGEQTSFKVTKDETALGQTVMSSLIVGEKSESDTFDDGTIKVKKHVETPTLKADEISSKSGGALTVSSDTNVTSTMTVAGKTTLNDELVVNKKTTLNKSVSVAEGLEVSSGDTLLKKTQVEGLTDTGATSLKNLSVSNNAAVTGSITSDSLKTGAAEAASLKVTGQSNLNNVSAKKIAAKELWLDTIGQVPALELAHLTKTDTYQVRFKFGTPISIKEE